MLWPLRNLNERSYLYSTLKAFKSQEHFALYLNYCKALFEKKGDRKGLGYIIKSVTYINTSHNKKFPKWGKIGIF